MTACLCYQRHVCRCSSAEFNVWNRKWNKAWLHDLDHKVHMLFFMAPDRKHCLQALKVDQIEGYMHFSDGHCNFLNSLDSVTNENVKFQMYSEFGLKIAVCSCFLNSNFNLKLTICLGLRTGTKLNLNAQLCTIGASSQIIMNVYYMAAQHCLFMARVRGSHALNAVAFCYLIFLGSERLNSWSSNLRDVEVTLYRLSGSWWHVITPLQVYLLRISLAKWPSCDQIDQMFTNMRV